MGIKIHVLGQLVIMVAGLLPMACNRNAEHGIGNEAQSVVPDSVYIDEGNRLVAVTFDTLRNALMQAIQTQGFEGAISFCQEKAYPITAAFADSVSLRRTALRYRNPANEPDSLEREVLALIQSKMDAASELTPLVIRTKGEAHYFKPIMLQPMCLNCHGIPNKEIQPSTMSRLSALYPQDQATGFKPDDLRGVWHIVFPDHSEKSGE